MQPVDIKLTDEQYRVREEEWKARAEEARFRMWTRTFPADMRYMARSGKVFQYEAEYVRVDSTPGEKNGVTIRDRVGDTMTLEYSQMSAADRVYVAERA